MTSIFALTSKLALGSHICLNTYLTMDVNSITHIAGLIGEAGRIQMLNALLDGRSYSASELAMVAGASPQTASSHLAKLLAGGLIVSERSGRQRLFRLKNDKPTRKKFREM